MYSRYNILLLFVSILILIVIVWYANPYTIFSIILNANIILVLSAFIVSNIAICVQVIKWQVLLKNINFKELFPIQLLGITISNFTPGKISEPIKAILLKLKNSKSVSETLPSIIWERIMDISVIVLLSLFTIQFMVLEVNIYLLSLISIIVLITIVFFLCMILFSRKFGFLIFKILIKFPVLKKMTSEFLETFYKSKISNYRLFASLMLSFSTWLLYGFVFYLSLLALGTDISPFLIAGILSLSTIIGVASSLPGGIGSTDAVMILLLNIIGVERNISVAGVLIARFLSLWYGIFLGGLSFIYLSKRIEMKNIIKL